MVKIGVITSPGGHLLQISRLDRLFKKYDHFWVTGRTEDAHYYTKQDRVYYAFFPESRNLVNAFKNVLLAFYLLFKEKPTILMSAGAGVAVPFFFVGKVFFGCKLLYIEPCDFVQYPSLTGKLVYTIADLFLIQNREQKRWYPNGIYQGSLL